MVRSWSIVLGIGLGLLGLAGLGSTTGGAWMSWLDVILAIASFVVAATVSGRRSTGATVTSTTLMTDGGESSGPAFVSLSLFAIWVIGMFTRDVATSMIWWNFAFGCAYGLLTLVSKTRHRRITMDRTDDATKGHRDESGRWVA
ncbi:MAG: hypothetical protein HY075_04310 [Deltaproteobacteria bacterium]|nr:hypothetical protein [Deltaproteobacteria bacterium]